MRTGVIFLALLCLFVFSAPHAQAAVGDRCTGPSECGAGTVCCTVVGDAPKECVAGASCPSRSPLLQTESGPSPSNPSGSQPTRASESSGGGATLENPLRAGSLPELLGIILAAIVQIGSILLVLALVWVGFLFVTAQGKEEKIRDARGALLWTVIGGMLLLGAQTIAVVIRSTVQSL
jgi:Type IV secretion system pilin